jgi:UDP-N-acetylmuramyl tripeptide synthase
MKVVRAQFLCGPNHHGDTSVAVIAADFSADARILTLGETEMRTRTERLGDRPGDLMFRTWRRALDAAANTADVLVGFASALLRDHTVCPERGHVANRAAESLEVVIPCDQLALALEAWRFSCCSTSFYLGRAGPVETIEAEHRRFQAAAARLSLDVASILLLRQAVLRGIPWYRILDGFIQLGQGAHRHLLHGTALESSGLVPHLLAQSRIASGALLRGRGLPVSSAPSGAVGYQAAAKLTEKAAGCEHSLLVVGGRMVAAVLHAPPAPGGVPTEPLRGDERTHESATAIEVTATVHGENRRAAEAAADAMGLDVAGVDVITGDIGRSCKETGGVISAVHSCPDLHPYLMTGSRDEVVRAIMDRSFPPNAPARIPTAAITGSLGKTTTSRMVAFILAAAGKRVGACTSQGVWVGEELLRRGDWAGGWAVQSLLTDPRVDAAVFEIARGGLLKFGMVVDRVDVGAILNIRDNHLGTDGVASREQMAKVKSVVARSATQMVVLNVEDPLCLAMQPLVRAARLCLVGTNVLQPEVAAHMRSGGCAAVLAGSGANERIVLRERSSVVAEIPTAAIPATLGGAHRAKVWNALFATAIAHGMEVPAVTIVRALSAFASEYEQNPGRFNISDHHPFRVILDKVGGVESASALVEGISAMQVSGRRILLLMAGGAQPANYHIAQARAAAGAFDLYFCCSSADLGGRPGPEIQELLAQGLLDAGVDAARILRRELNDETLREFLSSARAGDLAVVSTHRSNWAWKLIHTFRAQNA